MTSKIAYIRSHRGDYSRSIIIKETKAQIQTTNHTYRKSDGQEIGGSSSRYYRNELVNAEQFVSGVNADVSRRIQNHEYKIRKLREEMEQKIAEEQIQIDALQLRFITAESLAEKDALYIKKIDDQKQSEEQRIADSKAATIADLERKLAEAKAGAQ